MIEPEGPEWQEGRFLTLLGDPICANGKAFPYLTRVDAATTASGAVFGAVAYMDSESPSVIPTVSVAFLAASKFFRKENEDYLRMVFGGGLKMKCIDTRPDESMPQDHLDILRAEQVLERYKSRTWHATGIFTLATASSYVFPVAGVAFAGATIPVLISNFDTYNRFKKITENKWKVVDWPKPQKEEKKADLPELMGA